ncbi:MAG: hypothetical protein WC793_02560 [Candidatus Paceibacterota bacterium]|jgi:hypothetical protein
MKKEIEIKVIEMDEKLFGCADGFSKEEILIGLMLALSSKLILPKDTVKAVKRLMFNKKDLKAAFRLSKDYLTFVTKTFFASEEEFLKHNKKVK